MVTVRHFPALLLTLSVALFSNEKPISQGHLNEHSAASQGAQSDIYLEFEYLMASLGSATHSLIDSKEAIQYHEYLEMKKQAAEKVDTIKAQFYGNNGYPLVVFLFKSSPTAGINHAIKLLNAIADTIQVTLPSSTHLVIDEEKIAWFKKSCKIIEKSYKNLKPTVKPDGWPTFLKRLFLLNKLTRSWNWRELSQLNAQFLPLAGMGTAINYFQHHYTTNTLDKKALETASIGFGIFATNMILNAYLGTFEDAKAELKKKDEFLEKEKDAKKSKKMAHTLLAHSGNGPGFERIKGIQNEATFDELQFYSSWLQKPISFAGNRCAIMLYGEPGNGKGIITKALAEQSNTPMISISADDIRNKNFGVKLWGAEQIAQKRKEKSIIVMFDEIDEIIKMDKSVKHALLTLFDGTIMMNPHIRILFVCATNHINEIDPRILRPGRFKTKIYVGPPSDTQREKLITSTMLSLFQIAPEELVNLLVQETKGLSRVAIVEAIENTYNHAISIRMAPDKETFLREVKKIKDVEYHSSQQIA